MIKPRLSLPVIAAILMIFTGCRQAEPALQDYPVTPVPFTSVKLTDNFWAPRIAKNASVTIPIAFSYCESTGRVKNFEIAGGLDTGRFATLYPFDDSDVFKIIEGAAYSLQTFPDLELESYLDTLIWKIGLAQEDDGYLYTNRTIAEMHGGEGLNEWAHLERWLLDSVLSHELYNLGHLYEAAAAHYQATGKRQLLDIALKSADLLIRDFGSGNIRVYPGHQGIELGLVKLYRVTGELKYLDLARFFLDIRGPGGDQYNQAHRRVEDQVEAAGHSVRATYMYSAMADIAAIKKDDEYLRAITSIWEDIVYRKMYITGGIGATGGNEGFADPYFLPNMTAYCETCASIGNIFLNHRLFLLHGQSRYFDVLEKTLYNAVLSGVSLSADRFFYPNPLESEGQHRRSEWFGCACCPSNIARFIPAIPGYVYAVTDNDLYVNLFVSNDARAIIGRDTIGVTQVTEYPWNGGVEMKLHISKPRRFSLKVRIPGWAQNEAIPGELYRFADESHDTIQFFVNGIPFLPGINNGYATLERRWKDGDIISLELPMPVRKVIADERIRDDSGKVAIQRGPLIYCAEWSDNPDIDILDLAFEKEAIFSTEFVELMPGGLMVINIKGNHPGKTPGGNKRLSGEMHVNMIPYAVWANRGPGQMRVWMPFKPNSGLTTGAQK